MVVDKKIIQQTRCWLESVVITLNFCPFARRELEAGRIHFQVCHTIDIKTTLHRVVEECQRLESCPEIETTLLILAGGFEEFDEYLELLEMANDLIVSQGYEGTYQLASFHPDYCFAGESPDNAANYTNRSPYPILHLLRESSIEQALKKYPNPGIIPERNIKIARERGVEQMKSVLEKCRQDGDP